MISFIIIGRNEGWKLSLCLESVVKATSEAPFLDSEIIYVDSNSNDESISVATSFPGVIVFRLTGDYNAPIARNVGVENAKGNIFCFLDGDMELEGSFIGHVINRNGDLTYGFVSGYYINRIYNEKWELLHEDRFPPEKKLVRDYLEPSTGGLFIISRQNWELVGGMKNYLYGGADPDLAFRLAEKGVLKLRKTNLMAIHHTRNLGRRIDIETLLSKRALTGRILLYRENLRSLPAIKRMVRNEYTALSLFLGIVLIFMFPSIWPAFVFSYLFFVGLKSLKRKLKSFWSIVLKDMIFLLGFLFYWPGRRCVINYEKVQISGL
jgi:glycosyltransferase involved in cell wall biosynthesis